MTAAQRIAPQPGPQEEFLATPADIALYGGAAGGGKSYALLLEPLRHISNPRFGGVIFRRNSTMVRNVGGLWDESLSLYGPLGAHPREAFLDWIFPSKAKLKFAHLEHERSVYDWHGAQIPFIGFDELTHFTQHMFFYMLSRNRSASGIPGYVRATCNPDADSWVRDFIAWWIGDDGYPIEERSGVIRYFIRVDDQIVWADSAAELTKRYGKERMPKSFTFIPSRLQDNRILMEKDPSYLSNLLAQAKVERLRLLGDSNRGGNWNIRPAAGLYFLRHQSRVVDTIPAGFTSQIRYWDRAATRPNEVNKDPDWTRGVRLLRYPDGRFLVADVRSTRDSPGQVEQLIINTASHDGHGCRVMSQCDPGSAGKSEAEHFIRMLAGFDVRVETLTNNKEARARPVSAQWEAGNVWVLKAPWNEEFFKELEAFPTEGVHDDQVDALSGAFNQLTGGFSLADVM